MMASRHRDHPRPERPFAADAEIVWDRLHARLGVGAIDLLSISRFDRFRRVYANGDSVVKVVSSDYEESSQWRNSTLFDEFQILRSCQAVRGVPRVVRYFEVDGFEILELGKEDAVSLADSRPSLFDSIRILMACYVILAALCRLGISHNDLLPDNVLVRRNNEVVIIDFDQATKHRPVTAFVRTFFGIPVGGTPVHASALSLSVRTLGARVLPKAVRRYIKRILGMSGRSNLPYIHDGSPEWAKKLRDAWAIAQDSEASAPGQELAYYSLTYRGYRFPGERVWADRWEYLRTATDYSGKRVLELGCNMGLLSCFLLKEAGAAAALGVDHDADILRSARLVAEALDVAPRFEQVNFDTTPGWEQALNEFSPDVIFALNVLNWVTDKRRLLDYLASANELVYEGHDSAEVERGRLEAAGFTNIRLVTMTERNRPVFYCNKRDSS